MIAQSHRWNYPLLAIALLLLLTAGIVGVLIVSPLGPSQGSTLASGSHTHSARPSLLAANVDFLPSIFPATSSEFNSTAGQAWPMFQSNSIARLANHCLASDGYVESTELLPVVPAQKIPYDNIQFPDIALLESGSFGTTSVAGPPSMNPTVADMSAPERSNYERAVSSCTSSAEKLFSTVDSELQPLEASWTRELAAIDTSPPVVQAWATWLSCVNAAGIPTTSLQGFFAEANQDQAAAVSSVSARGTVERLAEIYGQCVEPVGNELDTLRTQARSAMVANHSAAVNQAERDMDSLYKQLSTS